MQTLEYLSAPQAGLPGEAVAKIQNVISTGGRNPILDSFETSLYVRN